MNHNWNRNVEHAATYWRHCVAVSALFMLAACGTVTAIVPDAEGVEHISAIGMGCNKPYTLTQDCSGLSGANRLVEIADFRFKIAGSDDGTVVLMMGAKPTSDAWNGKSTETANAAYEITKKFLVDNMIAITTAEPVSSGSMLAGYVITTDGDAYTLLKEKSVEK